MLKLNSQFTLMPFTKDDINLTYTMENAKNCIGHLRADMDSDGEAFFSSFWNANTSLKTEEFKAEFQKLIDSLREKGMFLSSRKELAKFCYGSYPDVAPLPFDNAMEDFGLRIDSEQYQYMFRLNPKKGIYNLYLYCYKK